MATAEQIVEQMRQVRCELDQDVEGIVENARILADWRHYVRTYPWLCLGAAAAAGFLLLPRRLEVIQPDPKMLAELVKSRKIEVTAAPEQKARTSVAGSLASTLSAALLSGGLALGRQYLTSYWQARHAPRGPYDTNGEIFAP